MAGAFDNQKTGVRILFGIIIGMLALSMLLYLVPRARTARKPPVTWSPKSAINPSPFRTSVSA